ncbi:protein PLASTID MOVEMENT IMPAIRED 1-RELATED 1-like isoform X1 [Primulina huaijiensis]|uniref:protein PLASTID MOVEMENT IMPAIRED 1-RELATED 1-like isoform X1 n=2 Tax=Primulina huaijiensis TaxID=1492673 RepID=UPI003CC706D5
MDMSSELKFAKMGGEDLDGGLFLHDIEEISQALYLHGNQRKALNPTSDHRINVVPKYGFSESRNKFKIHDSPLKDKKLSIWNWKPLKALTHNRNHTFNCCFFLHVHAVEGLPSNFNSLNLCVTWSRKGKMLKTHPSRAYLGMAEFDDTLMDWCTINCSRNRARNSANYEPKVFLLHTSVIGAKTLDIGKHWIDLTRLLPMTLEELETEEGGSGKWTTSFKLTGIAKGAMLNVSFGFFMMNRNSIESGNYVKLPNVENERGPATATENYITDFGNSHQRSQINYHSTIPTGSSKRSHCRSQSLELKFLDDLPSRGSELAHSVSLLYQKIDQEKMCDVLEFDYGHESLQSLKPKAAPSLESAGGNIGQEVDSTKFSIIEQDLESSMINQVKLERHGSQRMDSSLIEIINVAEIFDWEETVFDEDIECNLNLGSDDHDMIDETKPKENSMSIKEPYDEELDLVFSDMMASRSADLDSSQDINNCYEQETSEKIQYCNKYSKFHESLSLDDVAESIENDFLNMLCRQSTDDIGFDSYLESPRDQLLKQFDEDSLPRENDSFDTVVMAEQDFFCHTPDGYRRMPHADDFGLSPAILADEQYIGGITHSMSKKNAKVIENLETVALLQEWGLNEKDFQNSPCSSSGGFGSPVYVPPAEPLKLPSLQECIGPIIQIKGGGFLRSMNPLLFRNAYNGARLIVQVSAPVVFPKAMGLTVMELLQCWASVGVEKMSIQADKLMPLEDITGKTVQQVMPEAESISEVFKRLDLDEIDSDCVSFENIVPVAITNFEGLLIEGLRIQSGLTDQESPSKVGIQFFRSSDPDKATEVCVNFGSERTSGLRLLDDDELVKYSLSLEDWVRLDSEGFDTDCGADENGLKLLAAHCTGSLELSSVRDYDTSNKNFIMGLKVQLRDPLRDNERVGSSMLAMIEVERIPSPKMPCTSGKILNDEKDGLDERLVEAIVGSEQKSWIFEKGIPQFKFSEVHITGLSTSLGKELWGTNKQQQSGSRWLLSSGLGRTNKNHICKSKAIIQSSSTIMRTTWPTNVLWSISSDTQGEVAAWDEIVGLNVYKRNPDIIFP